MTSFLVEEFQKLQEAKEVLTNEESRKNYDLWLRSQITVPFRDWLAFSQSVKTVCTCIRHPVNSPWRFKMQDKIKEMFMIGVVYRLWYYCHQLSEDKIGGQKWWPHSFDKMCCTLWFQSMHWAVRAKKEPMLEDSKASPAPEEKASFSKQEQTEEQPSDAHLSSSAKLFMFCLKYPICADVIFSVTLGLHLWQP